MAESWRGWGRSGWSCYNAAHEAARASKPLSPAAGTAVIVTGVVVILEPKAMTVKAAPDQVSVVTERQLMPVQGAPPCVGPGAGVPDRGVGRPGSDLAPEPWPAG
jgi:hypothetical protein